MKIAAFQFRGSGDVPQNLMAIERGVSLAASQNVRFLITKECAVCGYPPVETESLAAIDFLAVQQACKLAAQLAVENNMYIGLGTIVPENRQYYNSIRLISPIQENLAPYHKRALWGWDAGNFSPGRQIGIYLIDGLKIGVRICYEVRFPEYFRELFKAGIDLATISFSDISDDQDDTRFEVLRSHLVTRAVENAMFVLSVNSAAKFQTAPTCLIDPDGKILGTAPRDKEYLLTYDLTSGQSNFGRRGRIKHSKELLSK